MPSAELQTILDDLKADPPRDAAALRARMAPPLRALLEEGHRRAEARLLADKDGSACAKRLSKLMDAILRTIHAAVSLHLYPIDNPSTGERLAVVATGGYGRGTLAPGSDIDLLFLLPYKQTAWGESMVEAMLYLLWDLKLKVGHATRSVDLCIAEAKGDITTRTALLEARFLLGDRALYDELSSRFETEIVQHSAAEFVEAKLKEREARVAKAGASRYLVEPNVKDGKGGLRDLQTLFWIAKYVYRIKDAKDLVAAGLFTAQEYKLFERCENFLWRVRCHLHFAAQRAEERLSFEWQRRIAARIGYAEGRSLSAVERFMKAYFLVAKDVGDLTGIVCAALEEKQAKPQPILSRFWGKLKRSRTLSSSDFLADHGRINLRDTQVFANDPVNLIRLFWLSDTENLPIHPDAIRLAKRSLNLIGKTLRDDGEANRLFLEILTSKNAPEAVLRKMNETGVLGRFIPDFGRIVGLMQFNMYHHYTVDEHLLRAVGIFAEIEAGRLLKEHPLAARIVGTLANRRALCVALFLHDIAKGRPEHHSVAGGQIARRLGPRFGLSASETDKAAWLVEQHLLMSATAQTRDLSDPNTIAAFTHIVQSMERLKLLLLLTICDIKAVGPGVWTGWKGELLRNLYAETEMALGGHADEDRGHRIRGVQAALQEVLGWSEDAFAAYVQRHTPFYWLKVDSARQIKQARFNERLASEGRQVATMFETDAFRGVTEFTVLSPDHPRLLAILTGACAATGGNIVDAQIFTTLDGMALDTIVLSRAFDRDEDEIRRAQRVAKTIEKALKGEVRIADLVAPRRASFTAKPFQIAPEVTIDNTLSGRQSVIEVSGLDRPGLLYDLTTAFGNLNLNIASAHIATFGEKAVDVFYVNDLTGGKITSSGRQAAIRKHLLAVFAQEDNRAMAMKT